MCVVSIGLKAKGKRITQRQVLLVGAYQMERRALAVSSC